MKEEIKEEEMLRFIEEAFEQNYELLRLEGGHALSPHAKKLALEQVKLYWKKMRKLAERVSETEVPLTLPLQKTPKGRNYTIQGVVDVVKEDDTVFLYDLKTHDVDYVLKNKDQFEGQLNIYAHIWQTIRGQQLDGTCVIATGQPQRLKRAIQTKDPVEFLNAFEEWNPEVPIELDQEKVQETITAFGEIVDLIEENQFSPPPYEKLLEPVRGNKKFVEHVCYNCDVRFSCESYKEYAFRHTRAKRDFLAYYDDYGTEEEQNEMLEANLSESQE